MAEDKPSRDLLAQPNIRRIWHDGEWVYVVIEVIAFLTESDDPSTYWRVLKGRLREKEGADDLIESIKRIRLKAQDGKLRLFDAMNRQSVLRLLQSVPSPKAEPMRIWLAQVGEERFEEIEHPELAIERFRQIHRARGMDEAWIEERLKNDLIRNELTDEWKSRGASEGVQFAILTNEIHEETFDVTVQAHKKYKLLPAKTNLRDHMTPLELALTSLSEATAITLHQNRESKGFTELKRDAVDAGKAGGEARRVVEKTIGMPVVSSQNFLDQPKKKKEKQLPAPDQPTLFDEQMEEKRD